MFFIAPLRNEEGGVFNFPFHFERYDDLFGGTFEPFSDFGNSSYQQFFIVLVQFPLIFKGETLIDGAILYMDIVDLGILFQIVVYNGEYVYIIDGMTYDLAFGNEILN